MPEKKTMERAKKDKAEGKSASTQAGEFVREEMHHIREGKHGAANAKQAIAIGLSKARRSGVKLGTKKGTSAATRRRAKKDVKRASSPKKTSRTRSRASERALKKQPRAAASHRALSRNARSSAKRRAKRGGSNSPRAVARRAARTRKAHSA
jgi:hypothetical protein